MSQKKIVTKEVLSKINKNVPVSRIAKTKTIFTTTITTA